MATAEIHVTNDIMVASNQAIGFFGDGDFGDPISLNSFNGRTFIVSSDGSTEIMECNNCKYKDSQRVIVGQNGSGILLDQLPNYLSTMNLRFLNDSPVMVQNATLNVYNGVDPAVPPSGLSCYGAEIIHSSMAQDATGLGDSSWVSLGGSAASLSLSNSPGISGTFPVSQLDTRHDWYVALSIGPTLPNDKVFAFMFDLMYL